MLHGIRLAAVERREHGIHARTRDGADGQILPFGPPGEDRPGGIAEHLDGASLGPPDLLDLRPRSLAGAEEALEDGPGLSLGPAADDDPEGSRQADASPAIDPHREARSEQVLAQANEVAAPC